MDIGVTYIVGADGSLNPDVLATVQHREQQMRDRELRVENGGYAGRHRRVGRHRA